MLDVKPKLTLILKERGITQAKLSELSGIPQSAISRFDRNTQHSDTHLFAIAKALGLNVEDLFEVVE
ncbi:helix-turn-helix domain-containing protein [Cohnella sp. WQ 127256]|uniref:helix-turn-helix domain-containing protein n=1 Tax=Cohnella sp. WQ 127256 TaxID=2938790 RepID=UPI002118023E|nr:helix-turn-helix transcriptional regulator [Cohnella sp. WQ 127256]